MFALILKTEQTTFNKVAMLGMCLSEYKVSEHFLAWTYP